MDIFNKYELDVSSVINVVSNGCLLIIIKGDVLCICYLAITGTAVLSSLIPPSSISSISIIIICV